jgi:hypothetical protein
LGRRERLEAGEPLVLGQVGVETFGEARGLAGQLARDVEDDARARLLRDDGVRRGGLEEEGAAQLLGRAGRVGHELAAVGEELNEAAQDFVVRARPDVLVQRLFERPARRAIVTGEEPDQIFGHAQILLVVRLDVTRLDALAALPAHR